MQIPGVSKYLGYELEGPATCCVGRPEILSVLMLSGSLDVNLMLYIIFHSLVSCCCYRRSSGILPVKSNKIHLETAERERERDLFALQHMNFDT